MPSDLRQRTTSNLKCLESNTATPRSLSKSPARLWNGTSCAMSRVYVRRKEESIRCGGVVIDPVRVFHGVIEFEYIVFDTQRLARFHAFDGVNNELDINSSGTYLSQSCMSSSDSTSCHASEYSRIHLGQDSFPDRCWFL